MNLKKWKRALYEDLMDGYVRDTDHPDCPKCGGTMNFYGHDEDGDYDEGEGYWKCSDCDFSVTEEEVYNA